MLYRKMGKTGDEVSALGFGCMRFPMLNSNSEVDRWDPNKEIDLEQVDRMIGHALDNGVNYFDTAHPYHGGKSESVLGDRLKGRRDKVMIATKLPSWMVKTESDFDKFINEQLEKLQTDYIDYYLLHGLNRPLWQKMKDMGALPFLDRLKKDGKIRRAGFSFHDDVNIFKEIVDGYDWDMCQIQYNYFDEEYQAGREGLNYAASKGLGVVIMEPLRGGKLTEKIPEEIQAMWDSAETKRTPAEWALRWVWNHAAVSTVLSGMSYMPQVVENVRLADDAAPGSLTDAELALIGQVKDRYRDMLKIDCTGCAYCMPCPNGVNIPMNFSMYNDTFMFKDPEMANMLYNFLLAPEQRASGCVECGECEEKCPQQISIMEELKNVHERLKM
jgi:predicted aldo/keto reductase-like oxidoreductase